MKRYDDTFEIETGVPIPNRGRKLGKECVTFRKLEVGQSFFVPDKLSRKIEQRLRMCASREKKKIIIRNVDGGTRVWRGQD